MDLNTALTLLKKRGTTETTILNELKKTIETFQKERRDFYINLNKQNTKKHQTDADLQYLTDQIAEKVLKDTEDYVRDYTAKMFDGVLDAINSKTINKTKGHALMSVLLGLKKAFINV